MRDRRTQHRLTLAVAAAMLAGLLTAWAEPDQRSSEAMRREIAQLVRGASADIASDTRARLDQLLPVARTIVSRNQ
ncbi:hypothetical protein [Sphingomonas sp.]|uniref:hypothetical protein n=1 Tax=Sphingomonas sp. TaxID=28214 RepID=UPI002C462773|nr:hypothetical protein [Sphingomonas sp.]HTG38727.1 hypothetical protein [Sphingomonas sp.]